MNRYDNAKLNRYSLIKSGISYIIKLMNVGLNC